MIKLQVISKFGLKESLPVPPPPSPPSITCRVITCGNVLMQCTGTRCLFISLTSPIKIYSANEPSLSPPVIKTYCSVCTQLSPAAFIQLHCDSILYEAHAVHVTL